MSEICDLTKTRPHGLKRKTPSSSVASSKQKKRRLDDSSSTISLTPSLAYGACDMSDPEDPDDYENASMIEKPSNVSYPSYPVVHRAAAINLNRYPPNYSILILRQGIRSNAKLCYNLFIRLIPLKSHAACARPPPKQILPIYFHRIGFHCCSLLFFSVYQF